MVKKVWRSLRCRAKHGHVCPHVSSFHQSPRQRARAGQLASH